MVLSQRTAPFSRWERWSSDFRNSPEIRGPGRAETRLGAVLSPSYHARLWWSCVQDMAAGMLLRHSCQNPFQVCDFLKLDLRICTFSPGCTLGELSCHSAFSTHWLSAANGNVDWGFKTTTTSSMRIGPCWDALGYKWQKPNSNWLKQKRYLYAHLTEQVTSAFRYRWIQGRGGSQDSLSLFISQLCLPFCAVISRWALLANGPPAALALDPTGWETTTFCVLWCPPSLPAQGKPTPALIGQVWVTGSFLKSWWSGRWKSLSREVQVMGSALENQQVDLPAPKTHRWRGRMRDAAARKMGGYWAGQYNVSTAPPSGKGHQAADVCPTH